MAGGNQPILQQVAQPSTAPDAQLGQLVAELQSENDYLKNTVVGQQSDPAGALAQLKYQASPPYSPNLLPEVVSVWSQVNLSLDTALGNINSLSSRMTATQNSLASIVPSVTTLQNNPDIAAIQATAGTADLNSILALLTQGKNASIMATHLNAIALAAGNAGAPETNTDAIIALIVKGKSASAGPVVGPLPAGTTTTTTSTTTAISPVSYGTILAGLAALAAVGGGIWWYTQHKKKTAGPNSRKTVPAMSADAMAVESPAAKARPPMFPPTARPPLQMQAAQGRSAASARAHARLLPPKR